jgi:RHS repeat-associated protein
LPPWVAWAAELSAIAKILSPKLSKTVVGHYNYFRDYDASIGKYIKSDQIGLGGGINTFAYSLANPLKRSDARGLFSGADAGLIGHFYFGHGEYADISQYCGDYLSDPMVQAQTSLVKIRVEIETRKRAGTQGTLTFSFRQNNPLHIQSIYSFGAGVNHSQTVECTFTGDGCCGSSSCSIKYYAVDRFDDPVDLCQSYGICSEARNVGGTPFWFGLSCGGSASATACKR